MPRQTKLLTAKELKEAEKIFLRNLAGDPVIWKDAKAQFIDTTARHWRWARDHELWRGREEVLDRTFQLLHRKAIRHRWIEQVDGGWQLTPDGFIHLQGRTISLVHEEVPDSHDSNIKAFLRQLRYALHLPRDHFDVAGEMPREPRVVEEGVEDAPLFLDLPFHARKMRLPAERNPCALYKKVRKLAEEAKAKRAQANEGLQGLIPREFARPVGVKANADRAPPALLALDSVLKAMTTGEGRVDEWMVVPRPEGGDVKVAGFTLRDNCGPGDLPNVEKTWSVLLAKAKDNLLETYLNLRQLHEEIDATKSQFEAAIDRAAGYTHFPGPCEFRAPGHKGRG